MNTKTKLFMLVTALLAVAACDRASSPAADATGAAAGPVPATVQADQADASTAPRAAKAPVEQAVATVTEVLESDPSLVALSVEEAQWLRAHGYPTQAELAALSSQDIRDLELKSRGRGDPKAATLLGLRRLKDGDARGAIGALSYAASLGSLYARQQLAYAELQAQTGYTPGSQIVPDFSSQARFVARMETVRILGDHRVDRYINQVAGKLDRTRYSDDILAQTTEFMRQIGEDAAIRGVKAPGPDPRPNQELWEILQKNPGTGSMPVFRVGGGG